MYWSETKWNLSRIERLLLANQYRILELVSPRNGDVYADLRRALEAGYELHYVEFMQEIADEEDIPSLERCKEILDILQMFRVLKYSYRDLKDKTGIDESRVQFAGFDGNYEMQEICYVRYVCREGSGRFEELDSGDFFDSHCQMLSDYQAMLRRWEQVADKYRLTKEDIQWITGCW